MLGRSSRLRIIQGSSEDLGDQRSFKDLQIFNAKDHLGSSKKYRDLGSLKDLPKIFESKDHSSTFGRSSRSKIIQGFSEDLQNQRSFKDLRKIFEITDHTRIFDRSSTSRIIQGSSIDLRDHGSYKDLR